MFRIYHLYADCSAFSDDSMALVTALLEEAGVAVTSGVDFGEHHSTRHLRFSYTQDIAQLQEGVTRIAQFLQRRKPAEGSVTIGRTVCAEMHHTIHAPSPLGCAPPHRGY